MSNPVVGTSELSGFESEEFAPEGPSWTSHLPEWAGHALMGLAILCLLPFFLSLVWMLFSLLTGHRGFVSQEQLETWWIIVALSMAAGAITSYLGTVLLVQKARLAADSRKHTTDNSRRIEPAQLPWEPGPMHVKFWKRALISAELWISSFNYSGYILVLVVVPSVGPFSRIFCCDCSGTRGMGLREWAIFVLLIFTFGICLVLEPRLKYVTTELGLLTKDKWPRGNRGVWIRTPQAPNVVRVNDHRRLLCAGEGKVEFGDQAMHLRATFSSRLWSFLYSALYSLLSKAKFTPGLSSSLSPLAAAFLPGIAVCIFFVLWFITGSSDTVANIFLFLWVLIWLSVFPVFLAAYDYLTRKEHPITIQREDIEAIRCQGPIMTLKFIKPPLPGLKWIEILVGKAQREVFFQCFNHTFPGVLPHAYRAALEQHGAAE